MIIQTISPDFEVECEGTIYLVRPLTDAAKEHFESLDRWHYSFFGSSLAVEHRFIDEVIQRLREEFTVSRL